MKYVYQFKEGDATMRNLLGGKGSNLCEMTRLGLPVPKGFIVSTDACTEYLANGTLTPKIVEQIKKNLKILEKETGKKLGSADNPLLISVRSGARVSMPGMMDSVLNLGLNDEIVKAYAKQTGNPHFAYDSYRRFIQMYSNVVKQIDSALFEKAIDKLKKQEKITLDQEFTVANLQTLIKEFKKIYREQTKKPFPQNVENELFECIESVFRSWNNDRAKVYRKINNIPDDWGTAVNVQSMVFGNKNDLSGTGVCFSRNPTNGENKFFGEFLMNAQGEDIVAGVRTPSPIQDLNLISPYIFKELYGYAKQLEEAYGDMQDMEFTIEDNRLYVLQTRNAKRTMLASLKVAVDLVEENLIDKQTALSRIEPEKLVEVLNNNLVIPENVQAIASGIPASPGGAVGKIVLSSAKAKEMHEKGEKTILVRLETSADDISGMSICEGILTARGGTTSHAAVVARGLGTVCVSGCQNLEISNKNTIKIGKKTFKEGDFISLDGTTGKIYGQHLETTSNQSNKYLKTLLKWAGEIQPIKVFANADTPTDAKKAIDTSAEGIGLCRTEHMFFDAKRVVDMQKMILSTDKKERSDALKTLASYQQADFEKIFKAVKGKPVTIRLLDPPLHEFMPKTPAQTKALASALGITTAKLKEQIEELKETNPMMGHRGLRLAITYPEIYEMQTEAIIKSAIKVQKSSKMKVCPEIMIPLTSDVNEFLFVKQIVESTIKKVDKQNLITYKIGTMIETPRACVLASELAEHCDFFSFGTNDLTQFTFGFSRDDAGKFLKEYYAQNIFEKDVFMHLDKSGVGKLMELAITRAKRMNPNLKIGICGEHAGDPESIKFCRYLGLDYVSCSVARLPIAQISSCQ